MALAPVIAWIWLWLNRRGKEPSTVMKFAVGLALIGVSFFFFLIPLSWRSTDGSRSARCGWSAIYLIQTVGELCLSPVGLSVTTKMAPEKYASQMMGVWFLAVTAGDSVTGLLSIAKVDLSGTGVVTMEAALGDARRPGRRHVPPPGPGPDGRASTDGRRAGLLPRPARPLAVLPAALAPVRWMPSPRRRIYTIGGGDLRLGMPTKPRHADEASARGRKPRHAR